MTDATDIAGTNRPTVLVLAALPSEFLAMRQHLTDVEEREAEDGTLVDYGTLPDSPWNIALVELGEGAVNAAALTTSLASWLRPRAAVFLGVAGSLKEDVGIGHVVVATKVYGVHGGKANPEGFDARPQAWPTSHRLVQAARAALRASEWQGLVHFKPVAAGDVVLNSRESTLSSQLRHHYGDAVAIEMESSGFAQAAHLHDQLHMLTVRGISDLADGAKHAADAAGSQPYAAAQAAKAVAALLRKLRPFGDAQPDSASASPAAPGKRVYGGDHIDFSGGTFHGPVTGKRTDH
ncbi:nucleosidase [Streptomyces sp. NPDC059009]|uniref:5'-methylthioadenosine/S-adenosylhomocysteine nucleosidase family protein n=1 Tax=Streptomyces sp. NPDC059009 TaxID=3346694 RepID=UPI0036B6AC9D